jgi:cyclopropane-fatty-acyl-phospholipid synthase
VSLFRIVIANRRALRRITPAALLNVAGDKLVHQLRTNRLGQSKRNIAAHYDLSNELYATFLDDTMTYSAAVFESPGDTLEEAQEAKYRRLAEKVRLDRAATSSRSAAAGAGSPSSRPATYGCRVTGITLSEEQAALARQRSTEAGLDHLVEIRDRRLPRGRPAASTASSPSRCSRRSGTATSATYFATIDRLLAPDGLAAIQVITIPEQRYDTTAVARTSSSATSSPAGTCPRSRRWPARWVARRELYVDDVENIGMHYAETLRRWRERFLAARRRGRALGFDDRFVRMWEFYLAYCEAAFLARYINDLQLVLTRPMNGTLGTHPYGRQLVPVREADLPPRRRAEVVA